MVLELHSSSKNVHSALQRPKGITLDSYNSSLVLNVVFHSSPKQILISWYMLQRSNFENTVDPTKWSNMSSNMGIRNQFDYELVNWSTIHTSSKSHPFWELKARELYMGSNYIEWALRKVNLQLSPSKSIIPYDLICNEADLVS